MTEVRPDTVTPIVVPDIVRLPLEIDIGNADLAGEELRAAFRPGAVVVIADMTQTRFADSCAVRALVTANDTASAQHAELRVVVPPGPVLRALRIMGMDQLLRIYPTLDSALSNRASPGA